MTFKHTCDKPKKNSFISEAYFQEDLYSSSSEKLSIKHHNFENVLLQDFLASLIQAPLTRKDFDAGKQANTKNNSNNKPFSAARKQKITVKRLFERLNCSINDNTIVIADVGDCLFGALDLVIHGQTDFLSPAI
jgi:TPP-dependent 2-oxoacid decarboxylase